MAEKYFVNKWTWNSRTLEFGKNGKYLYPDISLNPDTGVSIRECFIAPFKNLGVYQF